MDKPGYKTTEFWLTLLCVLATMLAGSGLFGEQHWAAKAAELVVGVLASMGYTYNRTKAKLPPS